MAVDKLKYPLVSVIIPTYSRPNNLLRALESVLQQTYCNIEIIVVDDNGIGSEFQIQTYGILHQYINSGLVRYIAHDINKNGSAARNTGLRNSKGKYVNFLDDDDIFFSNKIERQVEKLEKSKAAFGACYCNTIYYTKYGVQKIKSHSVGNLMEDLFIGKVRFNTSTILLRRESIDDINGFDETFERHQDWEVLVRFFRKYEITLVDDFLLGKYASLNNSLRDANRVIKYREKFLDTFRNDINCIGNTRYIYCCQYMSLALSLLAYGNRSEGMKYLFLSFHYGFPSLISLCRACCYFVLK